MLREILGDNVVDLVVQLLQAPADGLGTFAVKSPRRIDRRDADQLRREVDELVTGRFDLTEDTVGDVQVLIPLPPAWRTSEDRVPSDPDRVRSQLGRSLRFRDG